LALGDFELALRGFLGDGAPLSPKSIERLKADWESDYRQWARRDLSDLAIQYVWADGIYVKAGGGGGALTDGRDHGRDSGPSGNARSGGRDRHGRGRQARRPHHP